MGELIMAAKVLTDRRLQALGPAPAGKRVLVPDGIVPGLSVRVTDRGTKTFVLVRRYPGSNNPAPRALGEYGALTLEQARSKARLWLDLVQKGIDPRTREDEERGAEQQKQTNTFAAAFELFVKQHLSTLRTGRDVEIIMRRVLLPKWGKRPLADVTRKDVIAVVYEIHDGGSPIAANRVASYAKKFFRWAVQRGLVESSPAVLVDKPAKERTRDRVLTDQEIAAVWRACDRCGAFGTATRFMLATAARRTEAGSAAWAEVDRDAKLWRLPSERTKAARAHELPLNDFALACLGEAHGQFVFSNDSGATPIGGWSKSKARLERFALEELQKERPDAVLPEWHLHDLRRSVATNMARLGVDRIVISKVLNHADGGVTARYDRYGRDTEMVAAVEKWDARLRQIINQQPADVVPFSSGRRR
jgi:integrase